tara:strand:- start:41 stop:604 length:564 start_codon:yes stop_codon:yes gene_type:complete
MQTNAIIIDNFYEDPMAIRDMALKQDFNVDGNYPGQRTKSFADSELKTYLGNIVKDTAGEVTSFDTDSYNGAFQYTTASMKSWVHYDKDAWAGVVYLTPNAPLSAGTGFFQHKEHKVLTTPDNLLIKEQLDIEGQDITKWDLALTVGNVFNRLVLYRGNQYHMSLDYFGNSLHTGRLFQTLFFDTEH